MQIKTVMSYYYLTPVRMAIIKSLQITSAREDVEKRKPLYIVGGNEIGEATMEDSLEVP